MKFKYIHRTVIIAFAFLGLVATSNAWSEEIADEKTKEVAYEDTNFKAQANNPLASMEAFNFHNYFAGKLTDDGGSGPGQPEWQILLGFNIQLMGINLDTK